MRHKQITRSERYLIHHHLRQGLNAAQIGRRLNRRPRKILNLSTPEQAHYGLPRLLHF